MAERLAPEQAPVLVESSPERARRARRWPRRVLGAVATVTVFVVTTGLVGHVLAGQDAAPEIRASALIPDGEPARVLVVLARPGQEVAMAGTLAALDEAGAQVDMLSLTDGEETTPDPAVPEGGLGELRMQELDRAAEKLGVDQVAGAGFPEGQVLAMEPGVVVDGIAKKITADRPSVIITVDDPTGEDADSRAAAAYAEQAAIADGSGVSRVWVATRSEREAAWLSHLGPVPPVTGEQADVSVDIGEHADAKRAALAEHATLSPNLVGATYPMADRIPARAYFWFWGRESFRLAAGPPQE